LEGQVELVDEPVCEAEAAFTEEALDLTKKLGHHGVVHRGGVPPPFSCAYAVGLNARDRLPGLSKHHFSVIIVRAGQVDSTGEMR
jgi:hypothetical protein